MTDTQLLLHLAALMGWEVVGPKLESVDRDPNKVYIDLDGRLWRLTNDRERWVEWNPLTSMDDAMQVVEHLKEKLDCAFLLDWDYNHSGKWHAGFGIASDEFPDAVADTPHRAIALAALETREEGNT